MNFKKVTELLMHTYLINRWTELPRPMDFPVSDREALKNMIAYIFSGYTTINYEKLIMLGIASILRKTIITDIKNYLYIDLKKLNTNFNSYILNELKKLNLDKKLLYYVENYEKDKSNEKKILYYAGLIATKYELKYIKNFDKKNYEFKKIYSSFKKEWKKFKKTKYYQYYKKHKKLIDIFNSLRFQKRGNRLPLFPRYSVLTHMQVVAILNYFIVLKYKLMKYNTKNLYYIYYTSLFHDLLEVYTRDIITPLKKEVPELKDNLNYFENKILIKQLYPLFPKKLRKDFIFFLKEPFKDKYIDNKIFKASLLKIGDDLFAYNEVKNNPYKTEELEKAKKRLENKYSKTEVKEIFNGTELEK